jgi:hypothetical protein
LSFSFYYKWFAQLCFPIPTSFQKNLSTSSWIYKLYKFVYHYTSIMIFCFNYVIFITFLRILSICICIHFIHMYTHEYIWMIISFKSWSVVFKLWFCQAPVAHACNPSYSRGRDLEDWGSKSVPAKWFPRLYLENNPSWQRVGGA